MSFRRRMTWGPVATTGDGQGRTIYFSAAISVVEQFYPPTSGYVTKLEAYQAEGREFERLYATLGRLRGFKVEFAGTVKKPNDSKFRVVRYSKLYSLLFVIFGAVPATLTFVALILWKIFGDHGENEPRFLLIILTTLAIGAIGAGLAALLSGTVSRLLGQALSNEELDTIGQAIVAEIITRDPATNVSP